MTDRQLPGVVEETPFIYAALQPFGVAASVWDDALAEVFDTSALTNMPMPFQELLGELQMKMKSAADYPRVDGTSDHAYIVDVLNQATADYRTKYGNGTPLDGADFVEHDPEFETEIKPVTAA